MGIRNVRIFAATTTISFIMNLLGKGQIVGLTAWLCLLITQQFIEVDNPMLPAIFAAVIAYLVSSLFLAIFDFSALAILQCFITQKEDGANDEDAPELLRQFLESEEYKGTAAEAAYAPRASETGNDAAIANAMV